MFATVVLPVRAGTDVGALKQAALVTVEPFAKAWGVGKQPLIDDFGSEQRNEADHGIDVDALVMAVGRQDQVLEEAGLRAIP